MLTTKYLENRELHVMTQKKTAEWMNGLLHIAAQCWIAYETLKHFNQTVSDIMNI